MFRNRLVVGFAVAALIGLGVGLGSMTMADNDGKGPVGDDSTVVIEESEDQDVIIGGGPGSCGYQWDDERNGWHRPWDAESFIPADEKPEWQTFIPEEVTIEVGCEEFQQSTAPVFISEELRVGFGDTIAVTLCSNPTTGFQWGPAQISDEAVLELVGNEFVPSVSTMQEPPPPGTGGTEVWTFNALEPGTSVVTFEYSRPWEGGEKDHWTFVLTLEVE